MSIKKLSALLVIFLILGGSSYYVYSIYILQKKITKPIANQYENSKVQKVLVPNINSGTESSPVSTKSITPTPIFNEIPEPTPISVPKLTNTYNKEGFPDLPSFLTWKELPKETGYDQKYWGVIKNNGKEINLPGRVFKASVRNIKTSKELLGLSDRFDQYYEIYDGSVNSNSKWGLEQAYNSKSFATEVASDGVSGYNRGLLTINDGKLKHLIYARTITDDSYEKDPDLPPTIKCPCAIDFEVFQSNDLDVSKL